MLTPEQADEYIEMTMRKSRRRTRILNLIVYVSIGLVVINLCLTVYTFKQNQVLVRKTKILNDLVDSLTQVTQERLQGEKDNSDKRYAP